jgi:hypothetical protein
MSDNGHDEHEGDVGSVLDPTRSLVADEDPEQTAAKASEAAKGRWLSIFIQLAGSPRFVRFIEANYDIRDFIDDDKKTITTLVIEKPTAVGPSLGLEQLRRMLNILTSHRCKNPSEVLQEILKCLGQKDGSSVLLATEEDLKGIKGGVE